MRTKGPITEWRVEVFPETPWYTQTDKDWLRACEDIESQIKKHVDGVTHIRVRYDQENVCSYCKSSWTEDSPSYNGGCCDKDQETFEESQNASK